MINELLVSYLLNESDAEGRKFVEDWVNASPENRRYFNQFKTIWETSKTLQPEVVVNEQDAWQRFQQLRRRKPVHVRMTPMLRAAAVILLVTGLVGIAFYFSGPREMQLTALEEPATKQLPDGSRVTLNSHASLTYTNREVELRGEAFFDVKANKDKPFVVKASDVTITVLGTSFNVKQQKDQTEIIVESGAVKVSRNTKSIKVQAGEKLIVNRSGSGLSKSASAGQLHNYYRTRQFVCDNTPLWELVQVLSEAYSIPITIARDDVKELRITTTFHHEPLDNILDVVAKTLHLRIVRQNNSIILQ